MEPNYSLSANSNLSRDCTRAFSSLRSFIPCRSFSVLIALLLAVLWAPGLCLADSHAKGEGASLEDQVKEQLDRLPVGEAGIDQIMGELDARLKFSDEQRGEVRSVVAQGVAALEKLRARFEAHELTAMAFGVQVQMQMQKIGALVDPLLDPDQQAEYKVMRQEQRRQMMEAMRKQRMGEASTQ